MTKFDETETSDDGTDNGQIYPIDGIHPQAHAAVGPFLFCVDPAIPEDEIHLRNGDKTIGKIINIRESDAT